MEALRTRDVQAIWCLGDLVGDLDSEATVRLALESCQIVIAGNHDRVVTRALPQMYEATHDVDGSIERIRNSLSAGTHDQLAALPTEHSVEDVQAAHAALDHAVAHVDDEHAASSQLALADARFLALGHAHRAFCYLDDGRWFIDPQGELQLTDSALVCPGAVRSTGTRVGTVCVLDTDAATCSWLPVE